MDKVLRLFKRTARDEQGITGLETAIILIAFVVVATIFAFVVLTAGVFSAERGKETVFAGLEKARGSATRGLCKLAQMRVLLCFHHVHADATDTSPAVAFYNYFSAPDGGGARFM